MGNLTYIGQLTITSCGVCQIQFAMPDDLEKRARRSEEVKFYCPNGHRLHYGTNETQRLERELAWANTRALRAQQNADHAERSRIATKGHLTRVKKRIANGVCPCCNRQFPDLAAHMAGQHPDYVEA